MTEYFYRKPGSADFEQTDSKKSVFFIRQKNKYLKTSQYYCNESYQWKDLDNHYDALIASQKYIPVEFTEEPVKPEKPVFHFNPLATLTGEDGSAFCFEDFDAEQISEYLNYRKKKERYEYEKQYSLDSDGLKKDHFFVQVEMDEKNLTMKITTQDLKRNHTQAELLPEIKEEVLFFDVLNGKFDNTLLSKRNNKNLPEYRLYINAMSIMSFEYRRIPKKMRVYIFEKFLWLIHLYTHISYESLVERYRKDTERQCFKEINRLTKIPYEPSLWTVLSNRLFEVRHLNFTYERTDPEVFKKFCTAMQIRNTKTIRKLFIKRPLSLLTYANIRDCGFTDINLYYRILENTEFSDFIDMTENECLAFFTKYSIGLRGELATMNTLLKGSQSFYEKQDSIVMFANYFDSIPEELRKSILYDGFTSFNHNALAKLSYQLENQNVEYSYTREELSLCDRIDDYEFLLPENTNMLCDIGAAMHNCVASYNKRILKKYSTIVYVKKSDNYEVCIEVRNNQIFQELAKYNEEPSDEQMKILEKWHARHKLIYSRVCH